MRYFKEYPTSCFFYSAIILVNKLAPSDLPHWFYYSYIAFHHMDIPYSTFQTPYFKMETLLPSL